MRYSRLPGIDKPISRLVQGTVMVNSREIDRSFALLDEIHALGCTTFDTAHVYGRGVLDMAQAIEQGRPHRATGEQAAHVVEILCAIAKSAELDRPVEIHSDFSPPAPMDWSGM